MSVRTHLTQGLARQLGRPEGLRGRIVARMLNRRNAQAVAAAVEATGLKVGEVGADVGFGGGLGLRLMLDRVGPSGCVHGVELSDTMLRAAAQRHGQELAAGRLVLHPGSLGALPIDDGGIDGLVTVNTLYFVEDVTAAFAELARVLRPTGRVVVGVADPAFMERMPVTAHGFRLRPPDELVAGLTAAGLRVQHERLGTAPAVFHLLVGMPAVLGDER
jgi:arsenite methyltransferase